MNKGCLLRPPKKEVMFSVRSVCLSVCPLDCSQTCERILTKFFGGVGHGSRTKWYYFGGDPDHASDPGVQSPKSGSSGSAEVCAVWAYLVTMIWCECVFCDHAETLVPNIAVELNFTIQLLTARCLSYDDTPKGWIFLFHHCYIMV